MKEQLRARLEQLSGEVDRLSILGKLHFLECWLNYKVLSPQNLAVIPGTVIKVKKLIKEWDSLKPNLMANGMSSQVEFFRAAINRKLLSEIQVMHRGKKQYSELFQKLSVKSMITAAPMTPMMKLSKIIATEKASRTIYQDGEPPITLKKVILNTSTKRRLFN